MKKYVVYSRLSKQKKGEAQYGMESQENDIRYFLESVPDAEVIGEFAEFYSGKGDWKQRKELVKAVELCKSSGATLLVAKVDRLGRNNASVAALLEMIDVVVAIMPTADRMMIQMLSVVAEAEVRGMADRIRKGLAVAKEKGVKIGAASEAYQASRTSYKQDRNHTASAAYAEQAREKLTVLRSAGLNLKQIADVFTKEKCVTTRGSTTWSAVTVKRMLTHLGEK